MKLTICFTILCASLYAGATNKCGAHNIIEEPAAVDKTAECSCEMVLEKLNSVERLVLKLQFGQHDLQEQMVSNKLAQKKNFGDVLWSIKRLEDRLVNDVGRNMTLLQDQSMMILEQQTACSSHDLLEDKLKNFTPNDYQQSVVPKKETNPPDMGLMDCISSVTLSPQGESNTPATSKMPSTAPTSTSSRTTTSTTPPTTTTTTTTTPSTTTTTTSTTPSTTTTTTPKPKLPPFTSCLDVPTKVSGVYLIRINNASSPFKGYCEQEKFGGGWLVVQHRFNGSVDFNRNWTQYRDGFGEVDSEFWLGLERLHQITTASAHEVIIEMKDFASNYGYARYSAFQIGSESEQYNLKILGLYSGTAGDSLTGKKNGTKFSTKDQDNDGQPAMNYADYLEGAWWYGRGVSSNLNGPYKNAKALKTNSWYHFKNKTMGMSFSRMMIRESVHLFG